MRKINYLRTTRGVWQRLHLSDGDSHAVSPAPKSGHDRLRFSLEWGGDVPVEGLASSARWRRHYGAQALLESSLRLTFGGALLAGQANTRKRTKIERHELSPFGTTPVVSRGEVLEIRVEKNLQW